MTGVVTETLADGATPFEVTLVESAAPGRTVLFTTGRGGKPDLYRPLIETLAARGCNVVAPHFETIGLSAPRAEELTSRLRRIVAAAEAFARPDLPISGLGHSLGGAMLLTLAGGRPWTLGEGPLEWETPIDLDRLALITPATDFFGAPGALDAVRIPILAWAGSMDTRTPPDRIARLRAAMGPQVEIRVAIGAGHFTFMNTLPPTVDDPHPDRERFLEEFAREAGDFLTG